MKTRFTAVCALALLGLSCATQQDAEYIKDGKAYGVTDGVFRGRWWSYYERGVSFLSGDFYEEAARDFQQALDLRERDAWSARTYGLHFVEYFPNRELGVVQYHLGRYVEAETYLEDSLEDVDTARAHHYLDLVKRAQIQQGMLEDTQDPVFQSSIQEGALLASREIPLEIEARDDTGVARVRVNGRDLYQRGSADSLAFEDELVLEEGEHTLQLDAEDLADKASTQTLNVTVDITGPSLAVFEPEPELITQASTILLRGAAGDANGVVRVALDGQTLGESDGDERIDFSREVSLEAGENTFVLVAEDRAGNTTYSSVKVYHGDPDSAAAKLWRIHERRPDMLQFAGPGPSPALIHSLYQAMLAAAESQPLQIEVKAPEGGRTYPKNQIALKGRVRASAAIARLHIGGVQPEKDLVTLQDPQGGGGMIAQNFDTVVPLQRGENNIAIEAADTAGNSAQQSLQVTADYVWTEQPEHKMPLAVLAFGREQEGAVAAQESMRVTMVQQLVEQGRFNVVDRQHLEDVLTEQQLSEALGDRNAALTMGKVIPAHVYVVGLATPFGEGLQIKAEVINTETTRVVTVLDAFMENQQDPQAFEQAFGELAIQLRNRFPRVSSNLLLARDNLMVANLTESDGVIEGMRVMVVQKGEDIVDPDTGEVLIEGDLEILATGRLVKVTDKASQAERIEGDAELAKDMPVITM